MFHEKSAEDPKLHRCQRSRLEQRARAIESTNIPKPPPVRLGGRCISLSQKTTEPAMPRVPVRLTSSRSCIYMRRPPRAHPRRMGRNRPQLQPSFLKATRTSGGPHWWCSTKKTLSSRGGGRRLFSSASVRPQCAAPIIPLQRELYGHVSSLLGQILHCWLSITLGKTRTNSRIVARGTLPQNFHTCIS